MLQRSVLNLFSCMPWALGITLLLGVVHCTPVPHEQCLNSKDCQSQEYCGQKGQCLRNIPDCKNTGKETCNKNDDDCDGTVDEDVCNSSSCKSVADCADGQDCVEGKCSPTDKDVCTSNRDCADGQDCVEGKCSPADKVRCTSHGDCADGQDCVEGKC
ncbi:MAG: hypothetical protein AAGJ35_07980, partial [Myxococcota bacterium]